MEEVEKDVHLWMHAKARRARLGQKGQDSSLGQAYYGIHRGREARM